MSKFDESKVRRNAKGEFVNLRDEIHIDLCAPLDMVVWEAAGIDDPEIADEFASLGVSPELARAALDDNVSPGTAARWRALCDEDARIAPDWDTMVRFHRVGIEPADAYRWDQAGFNPDVAVDWSRWMGPEDAAEWDAAGFGYPERAYEVMSEGVPAAVAAQFLAAGFREGEVYDWATRFHSYDAAAWRDAGFEADDAERWAGLRFSPEKARSWHLEGFEASLAAEYDLMLRHYGVDSLPFRAAVAARYFDAGIPPARAREWQRVLEDSPLCTSSTAAASYAVEFEKYLIGPEDVPVWEKYGVYEPEVAAAWRDKFGRPGESTVSVAWRSEQWRDAGVGPVVADALDGATVSPSSVPEWSRNGFDVSSPAGAAKILEYHKRGVTDPDEARRWDVSGFSGNGAEAWRRFSPSPEAAAMWSSQRFGPAEAGWWALHRFDTARAAVWRDAGYSPDDAAEHVAAGRMVPSQVPEGF